MTVRQTVKCTKNNKKNLKILTNSLECTTILFSSVMIYATLLSSCLQSFFNLYIFWIKQPYHLL